MYEMVSGTKISAGRCNSLLKYSKVRVKEGMRHHSESEFTLPVSLCRECSCYFQSC